MNAIALVLTMIVGAALFGGFGPAVFLTLGLTLLAVIAAFISWLDRD